LILFFCLISLVFGQNKDCEKIIDKVNGGTINLGPLIGREVTWVEGSFSQYKGTICKDPYTGCGTCGGPPGICQYTDFWSDCIGKFSSAEVIPGMDGVDLVYLGGDWGNMGRIRILCDPNIEISTPIYETTAKNITIRSKYACASAPVTDCKKILDTAGSGAWYDLSPIIGQQLFWQDTIGNLKASICANNYSDCGLCEASGFCHYTNIWSDCVGKYSMAIGLPDGKGLELFYDHGDWGNAGRVRFICDPTVELSQPTYDTSSYFITVRSKYACLCNFVCVPPY